jgi:PAS domain S-box-containing protein
MERARAGESGEFVLELPRGELELRYAPVLDREGRVRWVAATAWDVTARREAERDLHQLVEHIQAVVANAPIVLFAFDRDGIITFGGGRGLEQAGLSQGSHVGRSVFEVWPDSPLAQMARRALAGEGCSSFSEVVPLGRAFHTTYRPVFDAAGEVTSVVAVAVDVTERIEAERMRAEGEARMRFLAGVSHELRTPLNSVLGFAQLLGQGVAGSLNERQARYVDNILGSGQHLLSLVNDLLDIERLAAGRRDLQPQLLGLDSIVRDAIDEVGPLLSGRALRIEIRTGPAACKGDDRAVRQVLLNLLSNAIKFSPEGGRVRVRAGRRGGVARVSVSDEGPGIPAERADAIFDEFAVMAGAADAGHPSTGLGLCLSRRLARAMGGDVQVKSRAERGSIFTLTLPAA